MSAPCVSEVDLIQRSGISGTTVHSRNLRSPSSSSSLGTAVAEGVESGTASRPLSLMRSRDVSRSAVLRCFSSSSASHTGRTNSRLTQPASRMLHPRMTSVPGSWGVPVRRTVWYEPGGMTVESGSQAKGTPEVLQKVLHVSTVH